MTMTSFTQIPEDIVSLRYHREQANKSEAIIVTNINHNAELLDELEGSIDFQSINCDEAFPALYTGYTKSVGLINVINTAQEIICDPARHNMRITKTKGKISIDTDFSPNGYSVPFWLGLSYNLFLGIIDYINVQAQKYGSKPPNLNKKNEELEKLSKTLQDLVNSLTSGEMDIVEYMSKSTPVVKQVNDLRNEINSIRNAQLYNL